MPRKEMLKPVYRPRARAVLTCLGSHQEWCRLLLRGPDQPFTAFLKWLLENEFQGCNFDSIQKMARAFNAPSAKVTGWIVQIYEAVFELNSEKPELFYAGAIPHRLHCQHNDLFATLDCGLQVTPRLYEAFRIPFLKAKMELDFFYVERVEHLLEGGLHQIDIILKAGFANPYRDFLRHRAEFEGYLRSWEYSRIPDWKVDDQLRKWYK